MANLTPYQVREVYLCPRNKDGSPKLDMEPPSGRGFSERELFAIRAKADGLKPHEIDRAWRQWSGER